MLLLAVAAGAIAAGLLTFARPGIAVPFPQALVAVGAVAGAVAVGAAHTALTGWEPFDLVLRVGFGALVPVAAARGGNVVTGWLAVLAAALAVLVEPPGSAVTAVATGAFLALAAGGSSGPGVRAVAAAAAVGSMAHAEWPLATGASAMAVAGATVPVLLAGLVRTSPRPRRWISATVALAVVVLVVGAVAGLVAALGAREDLDDAVDLARDGIDLLGDDGEAARRSLRDSAERFDAGADELRAWWARPALLVPGVAQQSRAVSTMASAGADLARTAATASEDADVDSIRPRAGRIDLAAVEALQEPLDRSLGELRRAAERLADVETPLLLAPVADRLDDLRLEVADAHDSAALASQVVAVAPDLLGGDEPRRYFLAFQTPSEMRGNGGFMGSWAEITATDGLLDLTRSGRLRELLDAQPQETIDDGKVWGVHNFSPDNPTVSELVAELYPVSGGTDLDGVIHATPAAFAGFLELTGPIDVAGYPERLGPDNAERILLHEQYLEFPQASNDERTDFLADAVEVLFDELTSGDLPGPRALADALGPAVAGRDLQLWAERPAEQALFETLGASGTERRGDEHSFGVVTQNYGGNKIDWFLERSIDFDAEWDPAEGTVSGSIVVGLHNGAPADGLPHSIIGWGGDVSAGNIPVSDGENLMLTTLYSTFPVTEVTVDGEVVDHRRGRELGHETATFFVRVPPGGRREVRAAFAGTAAPGARHVIRLLRQPMVNPDEVSVSLTAPRAYRLEAPTGASEARSDQPMLRTFRAVPRGDAHGLWDRVRGTS